MAKATGARSELTYIAESSYGTTPGTPAMVIIPRTAGVPIMQKEVFESADIRADRQRSDMRHGWRSSSLGLAFELRHTEYDAFFESAMYSAWATNVLKVGVTEKSFSLEAAYKDIARYHVITGAVVNETSISIKPDAIVTGTFSMVGKDMSVGATTLDADPDAAGTTEPFDALTGSISEGGGAIAIVTGLDFTISNNIEATKVIGAAVASEQIEGMCAVTGTVTAYFENDTLLEKFIDETSSSISVTLTDPASATMTFDFPNVLYTGGEVDVSGTGPIILSMPFTALYDSSEATTIKITRSA